MRAEATKQKVSYVNCGWEYESEKKVTTELAAQVSDDHDDDDYDDDDTTWLDQRRYINALNRCKKCQCRRVKEQQLQKKAA